MTKRIEKIRDLNDQFRRRPAFSSVYITAGVQSLGPAFITEAFKQIVSFEEFTPENDPHGEHDFGAIPIDGATVFFKIDTYDADLRNLSPDPADASVTRRVLTIMLAEEY